MGPDKELFKKLKESGLPGAKMGWPLGQAPALPWFTYQRIKGGEVHMDNHNYARMWRYQVDLYQADLDDELRDAFEELLDDIGPFKSHEAWIETENCWVTSYSLTYHYYN